jgi:hypothetical protein
MQMLEGKISEDVPAMFERYFADQSGISISTNADLQL